MNHRPEHESEHSRIRLDLARTIAHRCPAALGREIAVTGSVARGVADTCSDLELNCWVDALPEPHVWQSWLTDVGATDLILDLRDPDPAGFRWTVGRIDGIWVEIGWACIDVFDAFVRELAGGAFIGHERLQFGWTVEQAIALQTEGRLDAWKSTLGTYPAGVAARVIADQTSVWADPHVPGVRWALAARGERMGLALRFTWDMQNLLRVLFAMNHMWDHDLKWTDRSSLDLPIKPLHLSARIDAVFTLTDLDKAVETNQRLIIETLELAELQGFEVSAALVSVKLGLREGLEASLLKRSHT